MKVDKRRPLLARAAYNLAKECFMRPTIFRLCVPFLLESRSANDISLFRYSLQRMGIPSFAVQGHADVLTFVRFMVDDRVIHVPVWIAIGGRKDKHQKAFQAAVESAGNIYLLATSAAEAIDKLMNIRHPKYSLWSKNIRFIAGGGKR